MAKAETISIVESPVEAPVSDILHVRHLQLKYPDEIKHFIYMCSFVYITMYISNIEDIDQYNLQEKHHSL